jgi:hypothetical protein
MKVYVATSALQVAGQPPRRRAAGSEGGIKEKIKGFGEGGWAIGIYQLATGKEALCEIIEGNLGTPESTYSVRVNAQGQVRRV